MLRGRSALLPGPLPPGLPVDGFEDQPLEPRGVGEIELLDVPEGSAGPVDLEHPPRRLGRRDVGGPADGPPLPAGEPDVPHPPPVSRKDRTPRVSLLVLFHPGPDKDPDR